MGIEPLTQLKSKGGAGFHLNDVSSYVGSDLLVPCWRNARPKDAVESGFFVKIHRTF
jgi:hypothetical protein